MQRNTHVRYVTPVLRPLVTCLVAALALEAPSLSRAANLIVTNCNDSGAGTLRDAVSQAANGDTVDLTRLQCSSISLAIGEIAIDQNDLSLNGPGASALTIFNGTGVDTLGSVFYHTGTGTLAIRGVTVSNGHSSVKGGCIYSKGNVYLDASEVTQCLAKPYGVARGGAVYTKGNLTLMKSAIRNSEVYGSDQAAVGGGAFVAGDFKATSSTISNNVARCSTGSYSEGGGIYALGNVDIESSSIVSNSAATAGGLFFAGGTGHGAKIVNSTTALNSATFVTGGVFSDIPLTLQNSTIANNSAPTSPFVGDTIGVGLELNQITANIQSSIIANNQTPAGMYDVGGIGSAATIAASSQNNLIRTSSLALPAGTLRSDPTLGSLTYSGASAPFLPLLSGSPAINAGNNISGAHYDQRGNGHARVVGKSADIGAYETQSTGVVTVVGNCADSGTGSLRDDLLLAQSGDTLDLRPLHCKITLTSGELATNLGNVTLLGPGATLLTIDGNLQERVLDHTGYGTLALSGMTLSRGYNYQADSVAKGGCVYSTSTVTLLNSTVTSCRALGSNKSAFGGGIAAARIIAEDSQITASAASAPTSINSFGGGLYATYYLSIDQSTVSGNQAIPAGHGGGIYAGEDATVVITGSTISGNQAYIGGGLAAADAKIVNSTVSGNSATAVGGLVTSYGLSLYNSTVAFNTSLITLYDTTQFPVGVAVSGLARLQSSIIFDNTSNSKSYDAGGNGKIIGTNNLIGTASILLPIDTINSDPLLGPLQNNGGATFTHALPPNSPAVDAGNNVANVSFDQRGTGFARDSGRAPDIGAFEFQDTIFANGFEQTP